MTGRDDPLCRRDAEQRRADVLAHPSLNGIDHVEVDAADHRILRVHFLKALPPGAYGLASDLSRISISGGTRMVSIRPATAQRVAPVGEDAFLEVTTDRPGDFSPYRLELRAPDLDAFFSRILFSFMASCPVDGDCRHEPPCPPPELEEPALDYLAKDYASFRRLMVDLLPRLNPAFVERNPSDLGIALVELLAHEADHLSYFQDAVANEAFLSTLRRRISARRHARLVDYRMHDGRNAWTWLQARVVQPCALERGARVTTRIVAPLAGQVAPPGVEIAEEAVTAQTLETDPALAPVEVFETAHSAELFDANNSIRIHDWGNEECCLAPGTRGAYLYSVPPGGPAAVRPVLGKGDLLLLEEVRGPATGVPADADPAHRQVVVIDEEPEETTDPVYADTLAGDDLVPLPPGGQPLPLLRVRWRQEDALAFPLCLSARHPDLGLLRQVSVAAGNLVLVDHGITTSEEVVLDEPVPAGRIFVRRLARGPLTMQCEPPGLTHEPGTGRPATDRRDLACDPSQARPAVAAFLTFPTGTELWTPVPELLDSTPFDRHLVAEVDDDGIAALRFGDGEYGREPDGATSIRAVYRVGNSRAGNVGADSLAHLALASGSPASGLVLSVRNPLPARGGTDAETIEEVRRLAPDAFRAIQHRAVTEADYAEIATSLPAVAGAVASFRWTGSWHTVFVGVDPADPEDLVSSRTGRITLAPALAKDVHAFLARHRLAGYDLEIRAPQFVPIELDLDVCAAPGHFRLDVAAAVTDALSTRALPGGTRGFFHPDNFTFGDPVYLSRIYAAVERVEGVDSAMVTRLRRFGQPDNGELAAGVLRTGPWEIARCDNDPNFLERGVLRINALGGKA